MSSRKPPEKDDRTEQRTTESPTDPPALADQKSDADSKDSPAVPSYSLRWIRSPRGVAVAIAILIAVPSLWWAICPIAPHPLTVESLIGDKESSTSQEINADLRLQRFSSINDVDFVDEQNGAVVGDDGLIAFTSDGGLTWKTVETDWNKVYTEIEDRAKSKVAAPAVPSDEVPPAPPAEKAIPPAPPLGKAIPAPAEKKAAAATPESLFQQVAYQTEVPPTIPAPAKRSGPVRTDIHSIALTGADSGFIHVSFRRRTADGLTQFESAVLSIRKSLVQTSNPWMEQFATADLASGLQDLVAMSQDTWKTCNRSNGVVEWNGTRLSTESAQIARPVRQHPQRLITRTTYGHIFTEASGLKIYAHGDSPEKTTEQLVSVDEPFTQNSVLRPCALPVKGTDNSGKFEFIAIAVQQEKEARAPAPPGRPRGRLRGGYSEFPPDIMYQTSIRITQDGGQTWKEFVPPELSDARLLTGFEFVDPKSAYLTCNDGTMFSTADGGETWNQIELPGTTRFSRLLLRPSSDGAFNLLATCSNGTLLSNNTSSSSWKYLTLPVLRHPDVAHSDDVENGLIVATSAYGQLLVSSNGGKSWQHRQIDSHSWAESAACLDGQTAIVVGDGILHRTTNAGKDWVPIQPTSIPFMPRALDVAFSANNVGIMVLRGIVCAGDNPVIQSVDSCFRGSPEFGV